MATVMMKLGPITFELPKATYDELKRKAEYRWPLVERLGTRPARQWLGIGNDTIILNGVMFPLFSIGNGANSVGIGAGQGVASGGLGFAQSLLMNHPSSDQITGIQCVEQMRQAAEAGIPYLLTDGLGKNWGNWCIESVEEQDTVFMGKGIPKRIAWIVNLGRYADEAQSMGGVLYQEGVPQVPRTGDTSGLVTGSSMNPGSGGGGDTTSTPPVVENPFQWNNFQNGVPTPF